MLAFDIKVGGKYAKLVSFSIAPFHYDNKLQQLICNDNTWKVCRLCYRNAKPLIYCNYRLNCFEFTQDRHYRYFPTFINYWIKIVSLCKKAFMFLFSDNKCNKIEENTIACECQRLWEYAKMIRLKNKNWKTRFHKSEITVCIYL